jgi:hypothetical protein
MDNSQIISAEEWHSRAAAGLGWLIRSIDATGRKGSSHIFSRWRYPISGWHLGYPETTGYIIETLLDYHPYFPELHLETYALECGDWLLTQQLSDGSFPALLAESQTPSFFNSGMIAFGLLRLQERKYDQIREDALANLAIWTDKQLHDPKQFAGSSASYYSRAIWGFTLLARHLKDKILEQKLKDSAYHLSKKIKDNGAVLEWGFDAKDPAFTHTIAYTWRGFLELSHLWQLDEWTEKCKIFLQKLESEVIKSPFLAGDYNTVWQGKYHYRCVTGQAQCSLIAFRMFDLTKEIRYYELGKRLLMAIIADQKEGKTDPQLKGAIPGSVPLWGPYMRGKFPNWAVKFYLDGLKRLINP